MRRKGIRNKIEIKRNLIVKASHRVAKVQLCRKRLFVQLRNIL